MIRRCNYKEIKDLSDFLHADIDIELNISDDYKIVKLKHNTLAVLQFILFLLLPLKWS